MIIVRWLAMLSAGGMHSSLETSIARSRFGRISGPRRGEYFPARFPSVGWMTMRLDPVPWENGWSNGAPMRSGSAHLYAIPASRRGVSCSLGFCAAWKALAADAPSADDGWPIDAVGAEPDALGPADLPKDYRRVSS